MPQDRRAELAAEGCGAARRIQERIDGSTSGGAGCSSVSANSLYLLSSARSASHAVAG